MAKIPVGVQLYSVRDDCAKDLPGTMAAMAKAGYAGVEYAGYHGREAKELKTIQGDLGLACCGTHVGLEHLVGDALPRTVEFNKTIGNRYLIVPWLPEERRKDKAAWLETARLFNDLAARAGAHGMKVGYHNHHMEFQKIGGEVPWDIFHDHTNPDVVLQFDTGNALHGGGDPVDFLRRHKGRSATVHLKEYSSTNEKALVGEGEVKWPDVFEACESGGGTEWYIVEQESYAYPPIECVTRCLDHLRGLGKL